MLEFFREHMFPVQFFTTIIEVLPRTKGLPPICASYKNTELAKVFGVNCDVEKKANYRNHERCNFGGNTNLSNAFNLVDSILDPLIRRPVYRIEHLSPSNKQINKSLSTLKSCNWIDLATERVIISIPFIAKARTVFGNIELVVEFTNSGMARLSHTISYAKETAEIPFLTFSYICVYLFADIVLSNMIKIYGACIRRPGKKSSCSVCNCCCIGRCKAILAAMLPGFTEIFSMGLFFAGVGARFVIYMIDKKVQSIVDNVINNAKNANRELVNNFAVDFIADITSTTKMQEMLNRIQFFIIFAWL